MIRLPNAPKTFIELLGLSVRLHFPVFRRMLLLILFFVIVKDAYIYLGGMPHNTYLYGAISVLIGLLVLYLAAAMLCMAYSILNNKPIDWRRALRSTRFRIGRILFVFVVFMLVPLVLFAIANRINHWITAGEIHPSKYSALILVLVVGIPTMFIYLYYFFTLPLIAMENSKVWQAFKEARTLVGHEWRNLARVFGVYSMGVVIWILVSPDTLHGHLMKMYKVSAIFDYIVFSVTLPILMNLIILVRNDLDFRASLTREQESKM